MVTCKQICTVRAGKICNCLCCPFVSTFGLIWKFIHTYCFPCFSVLFQRIMVSCCWKFCCRCMGWPFEDDDFHGASALGNFPNQSAKQMARETDWVRAHALRQFRGRRPQLFEGKIEPNDLCQGQVGNCWLVAAFASASEFPHMIRHMFLTKEYNPRGLYKIRIFNPQLNHWVIVTVDDRIPCKKGTRSPRFMKPNGNELWAIILEKAYAKYCGSYAAIEGGFVMWGWLSMTGDNVFQMTYDGSRWKRQDMVPKYDKRDKRKCGFRTTNESFSDGQVWNMLRQYDSQKALISASIGKNDRRKSDGPSGEQMLNREGLVAGHAYSVIAALEVKDSKSGKIFRLMQLRNPWGRYEWKGRWSDASPLWKRHPSIAKQVGHTNDDDGTFWMDYADFKRVYTRINICDRDTGNDLSLDVKEDLGCCGIIGGFCSGCFQYWCLCKGWRRLYCSHQTTNETLDGDSASGNNIV